MGAPETCIALESGKLRALIEPGNGAKIRSLVSLRTGKEFFYQTVEDI